MSGAFAVAVLGGGAWGTALACRCAARRPRRAACGRATRATVDGDSIDGENPRYLPGVRARPGIAATTDLGDGARRRRLRAGR